ncbi:MAG: hypothetical protein WCC36_09110 [Gammaproteobacteria bacterium]
MKGTTKIHHAGWAVRALLAITVLLAGWLGGINSACAALTPGGAYTVVLSKINSDGTVTAVSTTSATADSNGKISFSLSNVPNAPATNFVLLQVKDATGKVVRQGIAAAPAAGSSNLVGINDLSDVQATALLQALAAAKTDDPIMVAFGLVLVRSPSLTATDAAYLASGATAAIEGTGGFVDFLTSNGVTAAQLATLRQNLVHNATSGALDLSSYMANFKKAVDATSATTAADELAKAGGFMADIFIDAASAAHIDLSLILAAHDAAGDAANTSPDMQKVSSAFMASIGQSMNAFHTRIGAMALRADYTNALTALGASGSEVTRFNTAVQNMMTGYQALDSQFADFFQNPQNYTTSQTQALQTQIDQAYTQVFTTFSTDIASTAAEISTMKSAVAAAMGVTVASLPPNLGTDTDFNGHTVNWPIPQTVAVTWLANMLQNHGTFAYTRDTLAVPSDMSWLNGNTQTRTDFTGMGMPAEFAGLMGLMEDVSIVQNTQDEIWYAGGQPTAAQRQQARVDFRTNMAHLLTLISGTTDGSTAISTAQKQALIMLMQQPRNN